MAYEMILTSVKWCSPHTQAAVVQYLVRKLKGYSQSVIPRQLVTSPTTEDEVGQGIDTVKINFVMV